MRLVAILIGLGPLIGWGIYPTIASKFGGKPVNQILGSTVGTLIFAIVYNQTKHLGFPQGNDLLLAVLSGIGWAVAQIITFYSFSLVGSSRAMPITTAFQLLGASLWGVIALGDWPTMVDKIVGFTALFIIVLGAWMTVWSENPNYENRKQLHKTVVILLLGEIGYWAYSAAPQAVKINGKQAFLPQAIGMTIVGIIYGLITLIKKQSNPFTQKVTYKQIVSGFFFAFAALTYLISAQPNMNGLATGFILSQTSVVLATLTGIWFLNQKKTHREMVITIGGLVLIVVAAAITVIV